LRAIRSRGGVGRRGYDAIRMPIYEFRCEDCGARFEELVPLDRTAERCPECGAEHPQRVLAVPAPAFHLVHTPGEMRKQERKNAKLREATKARFKDARRKAREGKPARRAGDG
jgi:putative FmdB family regulatory protein